MNLSMIDPFILAQEYPDTLTGTLSRWALFLLKRKIVVWLNEAEFLFFFFFFFFFFLRKWSCDLFTVQSEGRLPCLGTS